ncbi:MAG TPA: hypothetical protein V6C58_09040 [Allocoleopsis sp.]
MLVTKFDRLNTLSATLSEVNELKSQLLAELERIKAIENNTISEISDIQSDILFHSQVIKPDTAKLADITLKDCVFIDFDNWEEFEEYVKDFEPIVRYIGQIFILKQDQVIDPAVLPGKSNSPLQKAVDDKYGYHKARYYLKVSEWSPAEWWNLPELELDQFSSKREYYHANHIRKQIWYDCFRNLDFWKSQLLNWKHTDINYWLYRERLVKLPDEVKQVIATCPSRDDCGGFSYEIDKFVTDKLEYMKRLLAVKQKYQLEYI